MVDVSPYIKEIDYQINRTLIAQVRNVKSAQPLILGHRTIGGKRYSYANLRLLHYKQDWKRGTVCLYGDAYGVDPRRESDPHYMVREAVQKCIIILHKASAGTTEL